MIKLPLPPLPLPAVRVAPLPLPALTTDQLLDQMTVLLFYGEAGTWQARRRGCKDYGAPAATARAAMLEALK